MIFWQRDMGQWLSADVFSQQVALSLLRTIAKDSAEQKNKVDLEKLLQPPEVGLWKEK